MKYKINHKIVSVVLLFNLIISAFIIINTNFSSHDLYADEKDHVIESTVPKDYVI